MLSLPYAQVWNRVLYAWLLAEALLLLGGLVVGRPNERGTGRLAKPVRMALSAGLLLAALLHRQAAVAAGATLRYSSIILIGMIAGLVGDLIMAEVIRVPVRLIGGMVAFAVGHIAYLTAFADLLLRSGITLQLALLLGVTALSLAAWYLLVHNSHSKRSIDVGSLAYSLLIGWMFALALNLALADGRYLPLAIGALLFLCSDLILGNWVIRGHTWRGVNDWVWVTYVGAQMLIVSSIAVVTRAGL